MQAAAEMPGFQEAQDQAFLKDDNRNTEAAGGHMFSQGKMGLEDLGGS